MTSFLKFIRFYTLLCLSTIYYFGGGLIKLPFYTKDDIVLWTASQWGTFNLKNAGITLEVIGREQLKKTPAIFVVNHQSMLDLFIMSHLSPYKTLPVSKKSFAYIPVLGWFMKWVGVIFIDRYNPQKAMEGMKKTLQTAQKGYSILIAPEGTRTQTGELLPLKKGAFYLALQTRLNIIPITLVNAYQLFPRNKWVPKPGMVKVYIDTPITTSSWTVESLPQEMEKIRNIFLSHLG